MLEKIGRILNKVVIVAVALLFVFMVYFLIKNGGWIFLILMAAVISVWAMAFKMRRDRIKRQNEWEEAHPEQVKKEEEMYKDVKTFDEMRRDAFPEKYKKLEEKEKAKEEKKKQKESLNNDN